MGGEGGAPLIQCRIGRDILRGRLWPLCRGLHSGHYVQFETMHSCRESEGADQGLARRLTRYFDFGVCIVSEATLLGGPTSE